MSGRTEVGQETLLWSPGHHRHDGNLNRVAVMEAMRSYWILDVFQSVLAELIDGLYLDCKIK